MNAIPLGPYTLHACIGAGAGGEVWRATHAAQGVPVAVKVLTTEHARQPAWQEAFRQEVRAVAGLHHPAIVLVLDHGAVTVEAERASGGRLVAGSPFLVMELASGGTLKGRRARPMAWDPIRSVLLELLDALAHAHARGVIHRDVKPGNVLLAGPGDARPGSKLADFGIALATGLEVGRSGAGTPAYLAPELFRGTWRDLGPWTDLYAVGCVAWELVHGAPPFGFGQPADLARAHVYQELPELAPRAAVPEDLPSWLHLLLAKDPRDRFERAADAAWALSRLGPPVRAPETFDDLTFEVTAASTLTLDATLLADDDVALNDLTEDHPAALARPHPAPFSSTWRRDAPPAPPLLLLGVGLGLWGLRAPPLVGREAERELIWSALADVRRHREPRAVLVRGVAGAGKSRLASWVAERAHELGAAAVLQVTHSPMGGPAEGLAAMVLRQYAADGLVRDGLERRLARALAEEGAEERDAVELAEVVSPGGGRVAFTRPEERQAVFLRVIERAAARRPVVVWVDDAQWGADTVRLVLRALDRVDLPALFLLTVQDEALFDRPDEVALIEALERSPRAARVPLGPLEPSEQVELVRGLLGLRLELAQQVADRTAGNPLFAVQLLGDWVQRGLLEPSPGGFRLRPGADAPLPDDVHAVWAARVARVVADEERPALEVAACLGREVDGGEWREACALAGVAVPPGLVERLVGARLAHEGRGGWAFVHGMLREAVLGMAARAGRAEAWHRACAAMLISRAGATTATRRVTERRGRHLALAGERDEAAEALLVAVEARFADYESAQAAALLDLYDRVAATGDVPLAVQGRALLVRSKLAERAGRTQEAEELALACEAGALDGRWPRLRAEAVARQGEIALAAGRLVDAEPLLIAARDLHLREGREHEAADVLFALGRVSILAGDLPAAEARMSAARDAFQALGDRARYAMCWSRLGDVARLRRDWVAAAEAFQGSLAVFLELGQRSGASTSRHGLAEVDRLSGRLADAERGYREVIAEELRMGTDGGMPDFNLSLCLIAAGRYAEARQRLDAVRKRWVAAGRKGYVAIVDAALLPALVGTRELARFDATLPVAVRGLAETGMVDLDPAQMSELAGDLAARAGDAPRARLAYALALEQWRALGDGEQVAAVERALARLE